MALLPPTLTIPADVSFADLHITGDSVETLGYRHAVLQRVAAASNLPAVCPQDGPGRPWAMISAWYKRHLQDMGAPDPVFHALVYPAEAGAKPGPRSEVRPSE